MKWERLIPLVIAGGLAVWILLQVVPPTPPPPKEEAEITTIEVEKV